MKVKTGYQIESGVVEIFRERCRQDLAAPLEDIVAAAMIHYVDQDPETRRAIRERYTAWKAAASPAGINPGPTWSIPPGTRKKGRKR